MPFSDQVCFFPGTLAHASRRWRNPKGLGFWWDMQKSFSSPVLWKHQCHTIDRAMTWLLRMCPSQITLNPIFLGCQRTSLHLARLKPWDNVWPQGRLSRKQKNNKRYVCDFSPQWSWASGNWVILPKRGLMLRFLCNVCTQNKTSPLCSRLLMLKLAWCQAKCDKEYQIPLKMLQRILA